MANRPTEEDLHQEAVRNGEIEGIICQRCPWCTDPGLSEGETAFGVEAVNMDDPRPVGCDVNDCVNVIGYQINSESCWQEGFEALEEIESLGREVFGDSGRAEQFLDEKGVWSWYSSGGDTPGLGWTATYYCEEDKHRDDLKNAVLAEKADLEKALKDREDEEGRGTTQDSSCQTGEDEQSGEYVDDGTEPHTADSDTYDNTDDEIRAALDARSDPTEPSTMFWRYGCGLVTDEIYAYSSNACPRCGKKHPPGKNVTDRVKLIFRFEYAKNGQDVT